MKKFRLLLLDANVVIYLFEIGLWDKIVEKCEVLLSRIVAEKEANYFERDDGKYLIDLTPNIRDGKIQVVDLEPSALSAFLDFFGPVYLEKLDAGEAESLAYLINAKESHRICSADAIVFRVLAVLGKSEQGVSLEELMNKIGLARSLPHRFSKEFRDHWTRKGGEEMITGIWRKPTS